MADANCAQCGKPLRADARFCTHCGRPTAATGTASGDAYTPSAGSSSPTAQRPAGRDTKPMLVIAAAAVAVVVAVAVGIGILHANPPPPTPTPGPGPGPDTTAVAASTTDIPTPAPAPVPAPVNAEPGAELQQEVAADSGTADSLVGSWVPQVSSKKDGLVADGIAYDDAAIWANFQQWKAAHSDAILLRSGDYSSFSYPDFWVTVIGEPFGSAADANAWCNQSGYSVDDCYAKRLSHTDGPAGNTVHRG